MPFLTILPSLLIYLQFRGRQVLTSVRTERMPTLPQRAPPDMVYMWLCSALPQTTRQSLIRFVRPNAPSGVQRVIACTRVLLSIDRAGTRPRFDRTTLD